MITISNSQLDDIRRTVEGGNSAGLAAIVEECTGHPILEFTDESLTQIDQVAFDCSVCGWTMPDDARGEDTDSGEEQCDECAKEKEDA